jgi:RsiW-degrading membrane proteinase PrsW (M82 family)
MKNLKTQAKGMVILVCSFYALMAIVILICHFYYKIDSWQETGFDLMRYGLMFSIGLCIMLFVAIITAENDPATINDTDDFKGFM